MHDINLIEKSNNLLAFQLQFLMLSIELQIDAEIIGSFR